MLIIFAAALLLLQLNHFGNLTGQVIMGSGADESFFESGASNITITSLSVANEQDSPSTIAALIVVLALIVFVFVVKYILSHHKHVMHSSEEARGRKLIKLDLD